MSLRVGSLVYDRVQGLGVLAKSFVDAGVITDVLVVDRPGLGSAGYFPDAPKVLGGWPWERAKDRVTAFCDKVDVVLGLETFFWWQLVLYCRSKGIKTVLCPMYECLPPVSQLPYQPDSFICPSLLDSRYFPHRSVHVPVPVNVPWRKRERAEVFVHNAGNLGLRGRNGTAELVASLPLLKSKAKILIRSQKPLPPALVQGIRNAQRKGVDVVYTPSTLSQEELWGVGDAFVFPEKFNGLSLPLQEAFASGMLVMASDRFPNNTYLPWNPLIPVNGYRKARAWRNCVEFDEAVINPETIAERIDMWYGQDIRDFSTYGLRWAEDMTWEKLKPRYLEELVK